jgi:hypothetical protein
MPASAPTTVERPGPRDFDDIFRLIGGYRISQAIYVVAELGIPDLLSSGRRHCNELAEKTNTHPAALYRVLRFLAGAGLFAEVGPHEFQLTRLGGTLRADLPFSAGTIARWLVGEHNWSPWAHLIHTVRTGETAFDHTHGMGPFEYLGKNPAVSEVFNATMTTLAERSGDGVVERYDFSGIRTLVDVGGGHGYLLARVLKAHPAMRGVLFDLPHVVAGAGPALEKLGAADRVEVSSGSFFDGVPQGGDAYIVRQIIHDWDDDRALAILRNCRAAMARSGKLLVIERQISPNHREAMRVLHIDMEMLANIGGMERTDDEYRSLFNRAGLELTTITPLMDGGGFSIFEAVPSD